jgi:ABC-2 type transport system ATP-binding protein
LFLEEKVSILMIGFNTMNGKNDHNRIAIELHNVIKEYTIHHEKPTFVEKFIHKKEERFIALNNISLSIKKGERVGITGPNGSGKTTLLKIITGIATPGAGTVRTNGKVVSLIDLEAGFHADLTGIQNIFINGLLLGMTKKEINAKLRSIIAFADIHQFIDIPMFTYSNGMKLRLGFSVAIHAEPDILILDEGSGVGDANFQEKSQVVMNEFIRKRKTILLVSQIMPYLNKNCKRLIFFENGNITSDKVI